MRYLMEHMAFGSVWIEGDGSFHLLSIIVADIFVVVRNLSVPFHHCDL
jgi:hypothetical protein